jgi:hypothetical protein
LANHSRSRERRLDGLEALRFWYDQIRGKIHIDRYEILDPRIQRAGDLAVLTFRFESHGSEGVMRWNTPRPRPLSSHLPKIATE